MKIVLGSDHAGFNLKEKIKAHLSERGHDVIDLGAFSDARSDYPDYAKKVASGITDEQAERGVLVCGSGIGMCIAANRFRGVRAVVLHDEQDVDLSRRHNDANVACFGARMTDGAKVLGLVDLFLTTPFDGGRHAGRVEKIDS